MKNVLFTILALLISLNVMGMDNKTVITKSILVNTDVMRAWDIVKKLDNVEEKVPTLLKSSSVAGSGEGAIRTCVGHDNDFVVEKILEIDNNKRVFKYELVHMGQMPVKTMINTWRVGKSRKGQTVIQVKSEYEVSNPKFAEQFQKNFEGMLLVSLKGSKKVAEAREY